MNATTRTTLSLKRGADGDPHAKALEERLHKVLANAGLGSRRMLEQRIESGEVLLNGSPATLGGSVRAGDRVEMDQRQFVVATDNRSDAELLAYNKPEGVLTTRDDPEGRATVFEQLPHLKGARWIGIGRLDVNTTGLLLLTTDGELANALMHPRNQIQREYLCRVHGEVPDAVIERLRAGVTLEDGPAHFEQVVVISRGASHSWFRVVICEGRNREVRRMWESQGCLVSRLKRIRYGCVELPRMLKRGHSERLDAGAVKSLRQLAGLGDPSPTLTLNPVLHQRRANRNVTEVRTTDKTTPNAWTGAQNHSEARELTAWDRVRPESTGRRGKPGPRRGGKDVNGNVSRPEGPQKRKRQGQRRGVAPGQELPSVRTWFAGEQRPGGGGRNRSDAARGSGPRNTGSRNAGGNKSGSGNTAGRGKGGPPRGPGAPGKPGRNPRKGR